MTAKVRYTLAAIAGVVCIALTGATASVVMSAFQTAVSPDSSPVSNAPDSENTLSADPVRHEGGTRPPARVVAAQPVDNLSVADVTHHSPHVDATGHDVIDLLPAAVRRYCELATKTDTSATCNLLSAAITVAVPDSAGRAFPPQVRW